MAPSSAAPIAKSILLTTLIAGTLDIGDAFVFFGVRLHVTPGRILQNIASHLIGRSAFSKGMASTLLGLLLHYFIVLCWVTVFVLAAQRIQALTQHAILCGAIYGLVIYAFMNFIVLPHTMNPTKPSHDPVNLTNGILALVVFMGITVALSTGISPPRMSEADGRAERCSPYLMDVQGRLIGRRQRDAKQTC